MTTQGETTGDSRNGADEKPNDFAAFGEPRLGQHYPPSCSQENPQPMRADYGPDSDALGEPLNVRQVADLIGCSTWTVRHRHLREGLPHFRTKPIGKLIFYRNQIVRWLLSQQKGGV